MTPSKIDAMIDHFIVNLKSIGLTLPFEAHDRRARLEFARHYGVPSPLIDFTHSFYVALFFAFNGVRPTIAKSKDYAAIYCINIESLAHIWARTTSRNIEGTIDGTLISRQFIDFLHREQALFANGYPHSTLKYIEIPASWNRRMQRQLGLFLYDTVNYETLGCDDLEDFLAKQIESFQSRSIGQNGARIN